MEREAIFEAWAPRGAAWTPWAKPVLFEYTDELAGSSLPPPELPRRNLVGEGGAFESDVVRRHAMNRAMVVDLPGAESVAVGLALADFGYRPVPLYNALPSAGAVVEIWEIVRALVHGAPELERKGLPLDAPPAFLIDARRDGHGALRPVQYDNRSVVFVTDFPSVLLLLQSGIEGVVLIQSGNTPKADLTPILVGWQDAGLQIHVQRADAPSGAVPIHVRRPTLAQRLVQWLRDPVPDLEGRFGRQAPFPHTG
jgi:hypothetical protein